MRAVSIWSNPVSGLVELSFDNSANFFNAGNSSDQNGVRVMVSVSGLNLSGTWTPALTFVKSGVVGGGQVEGLLAIGHTLDSTVVNAGKDDWRVAFVSTSTAPSFREFTYASAAAPGQMFMTFPGTAAAVPEPASMALLVGIGLSALGMRRRRDV